MPEPTWSNSTTLWSTAKSGATNRHISWSHPNPCANSIGRPAGTPATLTRFRSRTSTITEPYPAAFGAAIGKTSVADLGDRTYPPVIPQAESTGTRADR